MDLKELTKKAQEEIDFENEREQIRKNKTKIKNKTTVVE